MDDILDEVVSSSDLRKYEKIYYYQLHRKQVTQKAQFDYAWCLVRSKYPADIRKGIILWEELYQKGSVDGRRDYIYFLAIGNARMKEYLKALQYVRAFLRIEPGNHQVQNLENLIKKRLEKEAFQGMAIAGSIVLAIGGLIGFGLAFRNVAKP